MEMRKMTLSPSPSYPLIPLIGFNQAGVLSGALWIDAGLSTPWPLSASAPALADKATPFSSAADVWSRPRDSVTPTSAFGTGR